MTQVNVTATPITVEVTENGRKTVVTTPQTSTVELVTAGPAGPPGVAGPAGPAGPSGLIVNDVAKVDKSIVYYDAASSAFKADATWTTQTIVDGANF